MVQTSTPGHCAGKNFLVTGGASGLGKSIAVSYAESGARVVIADRNKEAGQAIEQQLNAAGHHVKFICVDIVKLSSQVAMLREALSWFPKDETLDSLVLCAGINGNAFDAVPEDSSVLEASSTLSLLEQNAATLQVNLVSTIQLVQLSVKYAMGLKKDQAMGGSSLGHKSVTLIASLASYRALPRAVDYSAAKWGLRGAFRSLRQQLPSMGVRINMIAPAFIRTPMLAKTIDMFEQMGVEFASLETVAMAAHQVIDNEYCNGRAYAVSSEGFVDLNDDRDGKDAFEVMEGLLRRGALGGPTCPIGNDDTR